MRHIREILRQKWVLGLSHREVARSLGVSPGMVAKTVTRARALGLSWDEVRALDDDALERKLYGPKMSPKSGRATPDFAWIHRELRRPGVTLELLHVEYLQEHVDGYRYSRFCELYREWLGRRGLSMRQVHHGGEKAFVDYSGKKPHIVDRRTGERVEVELFVMVLGASNLTYAEATPTQSLRDWIQSHVNAFEYLGGVPKVLVPDQLKSAVTVPCRYEPGIQRTYAEMAEHYGTVVLPARPYRPKDKAKVEGGVRIAQRWILARIRNETFFSVEALNERIAQLVDEMNERTMRVYQRSRRQLFEALDKPHLLPLPDRRFAYGEWKKAKVNIDYHVELDGHYYSVHYALVDEEVELRYTATTVEIFHRGQRHSTHPRSYQRGRHTTKAEHMPKSHREHAGWTPSRLIRWASQIGPNTQALVEAILAERRHPEQGYRSCLGLLRLAKRYSPERLEAACTRALSAGARSYRNVDSILQKGLDRVPATDGAEVPPIKHENIRGPGYYH